MRKYIARISAVSLILFLTSCSSMFDKAINPDLGSPDPADNPAKGSFTAKVDGKKYTPIDKGVEFEVEELIGGDGFGDYTTIGISAIDKNYNGFSFILVIPYRINDFLGKVIDLSDENSSAIYQSYSGNLTSMKWHGAIDGYIRFSQVSPGKITGTFSFTGEADSGQRVQITDGEFNLYY